MTPSVSGSACEQRTLTMRPSSTVTVRLQVSGQSKVQTASRSRVAMIGSGREGFDGARYHLRPVGSSFRAWAKIGLLISRQFFVSFRKNTSLNGMIPTIQLMRDEVAVTF